LAGNSKEALDIMTTPTLISHRRALPFGRGDFDREIKWKNLTGLDKRKRQWNEREGRWGVREYVRVWIDVSKLDAMLAVRPSEYVGFAGKNGIIGKYAGVDDFVRSEKGALYMPRAGIHSPEGNTSYKGVEILDGRHRFAWMRDYGARALPVCAPADEAHEIAELVGTKLRLCRVRMWHIPERCYDWGRLNHRASGRA
jgi:hypothetical protein